MSIYCDFENKSIKGNVTAKDFEGCINCRTFGFSVGRAISMEPGNCANREATRASVSEVTFSHEADISAVSLFNEAVKGSTGKKVVFTFVQVSGDKLIPYMTYTLEDCLVSSYSISGDDEGNPMETISLSFTKIEVKYIDQTKSNAIGGQQVGFYDLASATGQ